MQWSSYKAMYGTLQKISISPHGRGFLELLTTQEIPIRLPTNFGLTESQPHPQQILIPLGAARLCIFSGTA